MAEGEGGPGERWGRREVEGEVKVGVAGREQMGRWRERKVAAEPGGSGAQAGNEDEVGADGAVIGVGRGTGGGWKRGAGRSEVEAERQGGDGDGVEESGTAVRCRGRMKVKVEMGGVWWGEGEGGP